MSAEVVFVRSFIPDVDGKINKYFSVLDREGIPWHFLGWCRGVEPKADTSRETYYRREGVLGGGISNALGLFLWGIFVFLWLARNRAQIKVVHAVDFDSAWPAYLFCLFFRKKLIFDVYDKYTAVRKFPKWLASIVDRAETGIIKRSHLVILADDNRYAQHAIPSEANNVLVLENVPQQTSATEFYLPSKSLPRKIGYFGVLERLHRGLEDLVQFVAQEPGVELHVVGYGPLELDMSSWSKTYPNIRFYGKRGSSEGLEIMAAMDIVVGFYYKSVPNHLFAAPNKYYEHLMIGRPLLTTEGTPPGVKVSAENTGWAIAEGIASMRDWLSKVSDLEIDDKAQNAFRLWSSRYEDYFEKAYVQKYGMYVRSLSWRWIN